MPRGRFLDRDRSTNRNYWSMNADYRNFWDLLVVWLDAEGRMDGDAKIIKGMVCPLSDWTTDEIEQMLQKFESLKRNNGLSWIERYQSHGRYCLWASGFSGHQKGLQKNHEAKGKYGYSDIPPPPVKLLKLAEQEETEPKPPAAAPIDKAAVVDGKLASMVAYFEQHLSMVTPTIFETLKLLSNEHDEAAFQGAVDKARDSKARIPIKYIDKVLTNKAEEQKSTESPEAEKDWT